MTDRAQTAIPARLGAYEVRAKIAEGGMASIYLGRGPRGTVALKVIKDELARAPEFVAMFLDEAKIALRIAHPNVVTIFELSDDGVRYFLAMELLTGQTLWRVWEACRARNVRLRYDLIAWIGARIADGLHCAHEVRDEHGQPLGVVHRDVNAANVFVGYDGRVKIIDFGLAKAKNRISKTAAGVVKGKLAYMSPEQTTGGALDRRTDIFALGTTLWELSVDRRLFKGKDDATTLRAVHDALVPDPSNLVAGYPRPLWRILRKALARDPNARYATAAEMAHDLDAFARLEGGADETAMSVVMGALFAEERDRQAAWIAEASARDRVAPTDTLRPPSADMTAPPPKGTAPGAPPVPKDAAFERDPSAVGVGAIVAVVFAILLAFAGGSLVAWKLLHH